jgi:hypothetical protein
MKTVPLTETGSRCNMKQGGIKFLLGVNEFVRDKINRP